jgi:myo-inositol-1(or 4)-monophosphatase
MSATLSEIEGKATTIAAEAGALLLDIFHRSASVSSAAALDVEYKDKAQRDPVSEADRGAERHLREAILSHFPDHAVLGEEGEDAGSDAAEYTWVLDPLDGTTNFVNGLPLFTVSVGVLRWGHPAVGAIWCSASPTGASGVIHARAGGGAWMDDVRVSVDGRVARGGIQLPHRLAAYPGNFGGFLTFSRRPGLRPGEPRTLGSTAYECALVAAGVLQSAIFWGPKIWDIAAGVTVVREASGSALTRERGRWHELTYFRVPAEKGRPKRLRTWSAPVVVGSPATTLALVHALRPTLVGRAVRLTRHRWLRRAFWLLGRRNVRSGDRSPSRAPAAGARGRQGP